VNDARIDAYIEKALEFAQPVLIHLRNLVHKAHPAVEEDMKWSRPSFLSNGQIVCGMSAFKEHCSFGFWGTGMASPLAEAGFERDGAAGSLGRITGVKDLPSDKVLLGLIRMAFVMSAEEGGKLKRPPKEKKAVKSSVETPEDLEAALARIGAMERFEAMSPSCRREYVEWIVEAKRPETRTKRIGEAVGWIAEGKKRNWKYENC
jgi:uncharacterized protein YdeI (YjbR/CyaY-like superfamily)